jgi:L-ascorbate metabolism protein UlaG (beta-lactamase superfamily)
MQQPQFGKTPSGERLERMKRSPNYKNGAFENLHHTPALTEGVSYYRVFKEFFFDKSKNVQPATVLPSQKIDLRKLNPAEDLIVWFGHSSYFMQIDSKRILVDPVLSGNASPLSFTTKSFKGADVYTVDELPDIDYLFISHDHYDHLDYKTVKALKNRVKKVITGLGVGAHLEHWGYDINSIMEKDWNEEIVLEEGFKVNTTPARHFSGRGFKRNGTLWMSFVLTTPSRKIYLGGDSGYDTHFAEIGNKYGPFDLVILENGQYGKNWKYIHMMPEEVVQAAIDLKAKKLFPVHWSKFALSVHSWDEPIRRVVAESKKRNMPLLHPVIGEATRIDDSVQHASWWERLK